VTRNIVPVPEAWRCGSAALQVAADALRRAFLAEKEARVAAALQDRDGAVRALREAAGACLKASMHLQKAARRVGDGVEKGFRR